MIADSEALSAFSHSFQYITMLFYSALLEWSYTRCELFVHCGTICCHWQIVYHGTQAHGNIHHQTRPPCCSQQPGTYITLSLSLPQDSQPHSPQISAITVQTWNFSHSCCSSRQVNITLAWYKWNIFVFAYTFDPGINLSCDVTQSPTCPCSAVYLSYFMRPSHVQLSQ